MAAPVFGVEDGLGEIVIDHPPLNLFGHELLDSLRDAIDQAVASQARAILIRAEGENFSAGANMELFLDRDADSAREFLEGLIPMVRAFSGITVPTLAAVQGICLGAGFEVALTCDLIWAAEGSQMGLVEAAIGAIPFGGGTQRLVARAGAGRAAEALFSARTYPAQTMLEWGVVNRVVPADDLVDKARAFGRRLASGPTVAHEATKRMVRLAVEEGISAADASLLQEGTRVMVSDDLQSGARSLLDKGPGAGRLQRPLTRPVRDARVSGGDRPSSPRRSGTSRSRRS